MATHITSKHIKLFAVTFLHFLILGLEGTVRISKLFNDTTKVKELMLWWSENVGTRISDLNEENDGNATVVPQNKTVKGKCYKMTILGFTLDLIRQFIDHDKSINLINSNLNSVDKGGN